jgi:hypothetical protein
MAKEAHMHPHIHHLGGVAPFFIQEVKSLSQDGEEVLSTPQIRRAPLQIVVGERVRHDQMGTAFCDHIVRELVGVAVAVIEKAALLHDQASRVDARSVAAVPAKRTLPDCSLEALDRSADVLAFGRLVELEVLDPAPAVTTDIVFRIFDRCRRRRVALERERAGIDRHRQTALLKNPVQAPEPDAAAIFEHALGCEVSLSSRNGRARQFCQGGVTDAVPIHHAVF